MAPSPMSSSRLVVRLGETAWRQAASRHRESIRQLLLPGLTDMSHPLNSGLLRNRRDLATLGEDGWTALDPKNPIYNFLIEYYGLKGIKGPRRLAWWSPDPELLLQDKEAMGILLEGATEEDFGSTLNVRGAEIHRDGVMYSPASFYGKGDQSRLEEAGRAATAFLWYQSILKQTLQAEPILHCHGLHEWAMQYHPQGASPPPSGKYQAHLPLRVSRQIINETVERKGVSCTHVDALRFFAPAAGPLNHHGSRLHRTDQLRLEQPACVHAHMDLIKITLRLQPFCRAELMPQVLEVALRARRLDVAASPYDGTAYGLDAVPVETAEGRALYRTQQKELMRDTEPVRKQVLRAYETFLALAFDESALQLGKQHPKAERFAEAEPGGMPWRKNLTVLK